MSYAKEWLEKNSNLITNCSLNTLARLDNNKQKTPTYIVYKTTQPLMSEPSISLGVFVDLPIGRMFNIENMGVRVAYLFEIPKQCRIDIEDNYFVSILERADKYKGVRVAFLTPHFSVFAPQCDSIQLVAINDISIINIRKII